MPICKLLFALACFAVACTSHKEPPQNAKPPAPSKEAPKREAPTTTPSEPSYEPGFDLLTRSKLADLSVEETLYEVDGQEHFFIRVRVQNLSPRPLGVDLRRYRRTAYLNQWGYYPTSVRQVIDEEHAILSLLTEAEGAKLMADFRAGALDTIPPGGALDYFREFNASGRKDTEKNTSAYLIMSLDGIVDVTDGSEVEELSLSPLEGTAAAVTDVPIIAPVPWRKVPAGSKIIIER